MTEKQDRYKPPKEIRHAKKRAFLVAYAKTGAITRSCDAADIHYSTYHKEWIKKDASFVAAMEESREYYVQYLEQEADRRAAEGMREYKFYQGEPIEHPDRPGEAYYEHRYSDNLLMFRLKALEPEKYRDRYEVKRDDRDLDRQIEEQLAVLAKRAGVISENGASTNGES